MDRQSVSVSVSVFKSTIRYVFLSQAAQRKNSFQVSTTTVTIRVLVKSLHPPKFQSSEYKGVVSAVGTMAVDLNNKESPLRIIATDDDYAATGVKL